MALVNAKLSSPKGAFASLTTICLNQSKDHLGYNTWLGDLKRVCEEAKVRIHIRGRIPSEGTSSEDCVHCMARRAFAIRSIDSAPVIPGNEV